MRPPGSSVTFSLVVPLTSAATTKVTVTDTSGIVGAAASVDPPSLGLSNADYDALTRTGYVVVAIRGSNDVGLAWTSGTCYPEQTVTVTGTAGHLSIAIRLIPSPVVAICEAVGGGPALRLAMATPIDLKGVTVSVAPRTLLPSP